MLKTNYYYLVAGLPDLLLDKKNQVFSGMEFRQELQAQLDKSDYNLARLLFLEYDNQHLLDIHFGEVEPGYNRDALLLNPFSYIPKYFEWADKQKEPYQKLAFENKLNTLYYSYLLKCNNEFLKKWFLFKLNLKNILATVNCLKYNFEIEKHLVQVTENRELTALLLKKNIEPKNFDDLLPMSREIFAVINSSDPVLETELKLDQIIWDYVDDETCYNYFSIEKILAFIIKLMLVERWNKLDEEKGQEMINQLIADVREDYKDAE